MKHPLYLVYPDSAESGTLETLPDTEGLELIRESKFLENYPNPQQDLHYFGSNFGKHTEPT